MPKSKYNTKVLYFSKKLSYKLDEILNYPITLIEAPMGYGKTTAIKEFIKRTSVENYWININSSSVGSFWNGFSNMISKIDEKTGDSLVQLGFPDNILFIEEAVNLISKIQILNPLAIIIDDYHIVANDSTDNFLTFLLKNLNKNIHIVISTRVAIIKDINELKLKQYINHITKENLELGVKDIEKYFILCGVPYKEEYVLKIYEYSEGWISALYLFMLNYTEYQRFDLNSDIYQLVINAVYNTLSEELKEFLYYICIFNNFSFEQVQFIYRKSDVKILLNELMQKNAFINYDYVNKQYHLHNIFSNCIMSMFRRLDPNFKNAIYQRAGLWYCETNENISAMEYFYKAKDFSSILLVLQRDMGNSITGEYKEQLIKYIEECPDDIKNKNHLAMLVYLRRLFTYNEKELFTNTYKIVLSNIEQDTFANEEEKNQLLGECQLLLSFTAYNDIEKMSCFHKQASNLMKCPSSIIKNNGSWTFGAPSILYLFYREKGKLLKSVEVIKEAMPYYYKITDGHGKGAEYVMEAEAYFYEGDINNSEIAMYKALLLSNDEMSSGIKGCALFLQIRILLLKGQPKKAIKLLCELREKMSINKLHIFVHTMDLCDAYIYSNLNKLNNIPRWITDGNLQNTKLLFPTVPMLNLVYSRVLLIQGEYTKLIGFSEKVLFLASIFPNLICHIYIHIHVAAALDKLFRREEAIERIKTAIDLAEDDMMYVPFVENCDFIYPLLEILLLKGFYKELINKILKLNELYTLSIKHESLKYNIQALSKREYEIAKLASVGLTNKEIGAQLFISVNTVKAVLKIIFEKLSIKSRAQLEKALKDIA